MTSLTNLVLGFGVSLGIALVVGLLMGAFRRVEIALDVYVNALLTAPSLVFAPIFFSIWGLGRESIIAVVVMYSCFIMIINTAAGVRSVPRPLVEMGTSFSASRLQLFRYIVLPAATPLIMAGVRLGVGRAVKGMINGEMFIAVVGLGKMVQDAGRQLDAASVLAVLIVIVVVAFVSVAVVQFIDDRLTSWLPSTARSK
jgi:NitT/TauT family transport system permease protein